MLNPYFSYENAWLWDEKYWKVRRCEVYPLFKYMEYLNAEKYDIKCGSGPYAGRTDGIWFPKTMSVEYPEAVQELTDLGLDFRCMEMGRLCWITIIPKNVANGDNFSPDVIVIKQSVHYDDPNWAMNVLYKYRENHRKAAEDGIVFIYSCPGSPDRDNLLSSLIQEFGTIFTISLDNLYLEVGNLIKEGIRLRDIPDFIYRDENGEAVSPDDAVTEISGIKVLPISGRWQDHISNIWGTATATRSMHDTFDLVRLRQSICGKKMMECSMLEYSWSSADDPGFLSYIEGKGLIYENHRMKGQRWISLVPKCACGREDVKLPTMVIFREVSHNNNFLPLIALSGFYDYIDLAAQGDINLVIFALEDPDSNDLLEYIIKEFISSYAADPRRVYVTGHSHNACYCYEFAARHPRMIAGVATEGSMHSLIEPSKGGIMNMRDSSVEVLEGIDMPVLNCNGAAENNFLINEYGSRQYEFAVEGYQRRLKASHCPMKTKEEIRAAHDSDDYCTRRLGVPTDRTEVRVIYGTECYIGHVMNDKGKEYLRLVTVDNMPHITTPMFPELSWSFLRRFARNNSTGELIELY